MPVSPGTYTITCDHNLAPNVRFIRVHSNSLSLSLRDIIRSVSDLCWISNLDPLFQQSFEAKAQPTADYLAALMLSHGTTRLQSDTGQYFVSEMARSVIINHLHYLDIPLGELLKQKVIGNPGFDLFAINHVEVILFGESKYVARTNAYGRAFIQIKDLINRNEDIADIHDIRDFCSPQAINNANQGIKGYISAFSSTNTSNNTLINGIRNNADYLSIMGYYEIVCIAVDVL